MKTTVKKICVTLCCCLLLYACEETGLSMKTNSTIALSAKDVLVENVIEKAAHVVPTENQYNALKDNFMAFVHFGPNTFTGKEWGDGKEDPKIFDLKTLDTDQWCETLKDAGMTKVILTVKHHDGFCLWQSRYTKHGIMSTDFLKGKGDVLKSLSASAKKYNLKLGIYLSPADLYQIENPKGLYGNLSKYTERTIPRKVKGRPFKNKTTFTFKVDDYNEYFLNQLFELLTEYGEIHEVWFDGAHPKRKGGQKYNYKAWKKLIKVLAPKAVIFGKQDMRWCGNESGATRATEWNVIPYYASPNTMNHFADITGENIGGINKLIGAKYLHYQPAEVDTSIRHGWFYRNDDEQQVRSANDVFDIYERSVGGNAILLLNIPPNREGKFADRDVKVLREVGDRIKETYWRNLLKNVEGNALVFDDDPETYWVAKENTINFQTPKPITINRLCVQEAIKTHGERVAMHQLQAWIEKEKKWKTVARATNIGYKRILRFPEVTARRFRLVIEKSRAIPAIANITAHYYEAAPPTLVIERNLKGMVTIQPKKYHFNWKAHGKNQSIEQKNFKIYYKINNGKISEYKEPFFCESGTIHAAAVLENTGTYQVDVEKGVVKENRAANDTKSVMGILKKDWKILKKDSEQKNFKATYAIDANLNTFWSSEKTKKHFLVIDIKKHKKIKGFSYTPQTFNKIGLVEKGSIHISGNGKTWKEAGKFEFGNLINDPSQRTYYFKKPVYGRYIKITVLKIAGDYKIATAAEIDFIE